MGSEVSTLKEEENENESDILQETNMEQTEVPVDEPGYPEACPPPDKKKDIFRREHYIDIDNRARSVPQDKANSYGELIQCLTQDLNNNMQTLRAIFVWLGQQDIESKNYSKVTSADTPTGYMKLIMERKGSYATFFALLCRFVRGTRRRLKFGDHFYFLKDTFSAANIPCVIVKGKAKSAAYEVGMTEEECKRLDNSWNAVYVSGGWRLVFPFWACRALVGHAAGGFVKIEAGGNAVRQKEKASEGVSVRQLNEYYFLTNPEDLIFTCFPQDKKWQLLGSPWSYQKFAEVPHCRQTYFEDKVSITSNLNCRLETVDGECTVSVRGKKEYFFDYELYYNEKESIKPISEELQLQRYILKKHEKSDVEFTVRFPQAGIYKLQIVGGETLNSKSDLCSFKIFCKDPKEDCQPLPISPTIGFGPSDEMERMGVKAQSHKMAIVRIQACKEITMTFKRKRNVSVETVLVHNSLGKEELKRVLKQTVEESNITVKIRVIQRGEYALQMFAKPEDSTQEHQNICNYLLTSETGKKRTRTYENAEEKIARNRINELTKSRTDIEGLQKAIETFQDLALEDKGDLSKAIDALELGRAEKELKDAIQRRRIDCLDSAIEQAKENKFHNKLHSRISEAEELRDHLRNLKTYNHDVLAMKQSTISEIRSYKQPPQVVHDVMMASYILLGEKRQEVENWENIICLLGLTGRESLLRRVKDFDAMKVDAGTYADVQSLLKKHTEDDVRAASAGAGTFYVWLLKVSDTMVTWFSSA